MGGYLCSALVVKEWVDQNWLRLRNLPEERKSAKHSSRSFKSAPKKGEYPFTHAIQLSITGSGKCNNVTF